MARGEDAAAAKAIEDPYKPQGPSDRVPTEPVSIAVALADKLDVLVGFWAVDEKPTGSKDPFALRRAALGVIRILLENQIRTPLTEIFAFAILGRALSPTERSAMFVGSTIDIVKSVLSVTRESGGSFEALTKVMASDGNLLAFFADRLKVQLREAGARHDLVDAVFALGTAEKPQDDLVLVVKRVEALAGFLGTEDGKALLAGYTRAANILKAEEKKDGKSFDGEPDASLLAEPAEKALAEAVATARATAAAAVGAEDFAAAMSALAALRAPVDAFFDAILVNAPEAAVRENRLKLLTRIRAACHTVADFSRIG